MRGLARLLVVTAIVASFTIVCGAPNGFCDPNGQAKCRTDLSVKLAGPSKATAGQSLALDVAAQDNPDANMDATFNKGLSVVLISNALKEVEALLKAAVDDAQVVVYDAEQDGLADINAILRHMVETTGSKIGHLAVVSHGAPGLLRFGDGEIWTTASVTEQTRAWNSLGGLLSENARIDLYGCAIGAGHKGALFVKTLASTTGAVVWASDDPTGNVRNADWALEVRTDAGVELALLDMASLDGTPILLPWTNIREKGCDLSLCGGLCPSIDTGAGQDIVSVLINGIVNGYITLGSGNDAVTIAGGTVNGHIDGNTGNDTVSNTGQVLGHIDGNTGNDRVENMGTVANIKLGEGVDSLTNTGSVFKAIWGGPGMDSIENHGSAGDIYGGNPGLVGDDPNVIFNDGYAKCLYGGDGANWIWNAGTAHDLVGGPKVDLLLNSGSCHMLTGNDGDDSISNQGTGNAQGISGGDGDDLITNSGTIKGESDSILGGAGNDTINNSGAVYGAISAGEGDDTVHYEGGIVKGTITGGKGNDTLHLTAACTNITGSPASGSCQWQGHEIQWSEFENIVRGKGDKTQSRIPEDRVKTVAQNPPSR